MTYAADLHGTCTEFQWGEIAFITDKEELKPGQIIFRRTDVEHDNWYCESFKKQTRDELLNMKVFYSHAWKARARRLRRGADANSALTFHLDLP
jgi:hypothetical protein